MAAAASSGRERVIPLIEVKDNMYVPNEEALKFLESIDQPLGVISAAGPYRTGKSFLLNRLLKCKRGQGFGVGITTRACTKGLWICTKTIMATSEKGGQFPCIVMDTEGIGATTAGGTHDTRIFCLALLLSSFFIYNSDGTIDERALSNLGLVANLSEQVRISQTEEDQEEEAKKSELGQHYFPDFLWIVRNFGLIPTNEKGERITPKEYLDSALENTVVGDKQKLSDVDRASLEEKNRLRDTLKSFFPFEKRDCATLVRPVIEEEDLQSLDIKEDKELRPEFNKQINDIFAGITSRVKPKMAMGKPINGKLLAALCKSYCSAMNSGTAPVIKDHWVMLCELQGKDAVEKSLKEWQDTISGMLSDQGPFPPQQLEELYATAQIAAERCFKKFSLGSAEDMKPFIEKLKFELSEKREHVQTQNNRAIKDHFVAELSRLDTEVAKMPQPSVQEVHKLYASMHRKLQERFPTVADLWALLALPKVWNWAFQCSTFSERALEELEKIKREWSEVNAKLQTAQDNRAQLEKQCEALKSACTDLEMQLSRALTESEALKEEMNTVIKTALETAQRDLSQVTQEREEKSAKVELLEAQIEQQRDEERTVKVKEAELEMCRAELSETTLKWETCVAENGELAKQIAALQQQMQRQPVLNQQMLDEKNAEIEALKREMDEGQQKFKTTLKRMEKDTMSAIEEARQAQFIEKEYLTAAAAKSEKAAKQSEEKWVKAREEFDEQMQQKKKEMERIKISEDEKNAKMVEMQLLISEKAKDFVKLQTQSRLEVKELTDRHTQELKDRDAQEKEMHVRKTEELREAFSKQKDMETKVQIAELQVSNYKRRMEDFEDMPTAKKLKTDLEKASNDLGKCKNRCDWLEESKSAQEKELETLKARTRVLERELRDKESDFAIQCNDMRVSYERKIISLETKISQLISSSN
jgi:hypothetical protein